MRKMLLFSLQNKKYISNVNVCYKNVADHSVLHKNIIIQLCHELRLNSNRKILLFSLQNKKYISNVNVCYKNVAEHSVLHKKNTI